MNKKKTSLFLTAFVVLCLATAIAVGVFASTNASAPYVSDKQGEVQPLATTSAPAGDGSVSHQYTISDKPAEYTAIGGDSGRDFSTVRGTPSGNYMLVGDVNVDSADYGTTFTGTIDGNGHKIIMNVDQDSGNTVVGGLFAYFRGVLKNVTIQVNFFSIGGDNCNMEAGVLFGHLQGGTIDNVKLELNHVPKSATNGSSDFYMHQHSQRTSTFSSVYLIFGGVAGKSFGGTISNFTLANNSGTAYGFGINGWRDSGNIWTMNQFLGGLIGEVNPKDNDSEVRTDTYLTNIKVTGSGNYINYNDSSDRRKNDMFTGFLVGYCNEYTTHIDGVILDYYGTITTQNGATVKSGMVVGQTDEGNLGTLKNVYYNTSALVYNSVLVVGSSNSYNSVIKYNASCSPEFDGNNIWFYGADIVAPDSADLVYQIQNGSQIQVVADQLILGNGEIPCKGWVNVAKAGDSAQGSTAGAVNLSYSKVTQYTYGVSTDMTLTGGDGSYTYYEKTYDGNLITVPTITLNNPSGGITISNVFSESGAHRNVGEHILSYNASAIGDAGYTAYKYNGKLVIGSPLSGIMYVPAAYQASDGTNIIDIAKDVKVTVNKLDITIGFNSTNYITYGDTVEAVKANNTDVVIMSGNAPDSIVDWEISGYVPYAHNTGALIPISVANVTMSNDSTGNYNITYPTKDVPVVARQIKGEISLADGISLVYDGNPKTAKFTITSGAESDPEIGESITFEYSGDNVNVGTFTVTAKLPAVDGVQNYQFSLDSTTSAEYTITPMALTISAKAPQSKYYDGTEFTDYASLFEVPAGAKGEEVTFDYTVASGSIIDTGVYTVNAALSASETNYTAGGASVQFTVNKAQIKGTIQMPADMSYDGTAKVPTYVFEDCALCNEGEEITFGYSGSNVNAGTITVKANLPSENYEFIVEGSASATQTAQMVISKRNVSLSVDNIVKTYDGTVYDFSSVEISGTDAFVDEFTASVSSPTATENVGSYALVITTSLDSDSNYEITKDTDKTLTVNPKSVNLSVEDATKVYDGKLYDFDGYTVSGMDGFVASDAVTATVSATGEKADKGVYPLVIATSADSDPNYTITRSQDKNLTVTARKVSVTVDNATKIYDAKLYDFTDYAVEIGGDGFVAEDNVTVTVSAQGEKADKGVYPLVIATSADGNPNYEITRSQDKTLTVNALTVTVSAKEPQSKIYDGAAFSDFASLFNIPSGITAEGEGEPLVFDYSITKDDAPVGEIVNAGTYVVTATLAAGQDNYVCESASVEYTVNPMTVVIEATQSEAVGAYDGKAVGANEITKYFVIPNDVEGNPLAVKITVSGPDTQILNAGTYTVEVSLDDKSGNYVAQSASITYILNKQIVTIPVPEERIFTYNGSKFTYAIAANVSKYSISGNTGTDAGNYTAVLTLNDPANYQWSNGSSEPYEIGWSIKQANSHVTPVIGGGEYFAGHAMPSITTSEGDTEGEIKWQESVLVLGINEYHWTFTPADSKNYKAASGTVTSIVPKAVEVESISAEYTAGEEPVYTSTPVDSLKQYITVKTVNNDGSIADELTADEFTLSGTLIAGTSTLTVSYGSFSTSVSIDNVIGVVLERIELTEAPRKSAYTVFETLDTAGMVITAFYTDNTSKVVTDDCTASVSTLAIYTTEVVFSYTESEVTKTVSFSVTVAKIKVAAPDVDEAQHFVYNSQVQTFEILAGEHYTVSGNTGTQAQDYTAVIALKDKTNYEWTTGNTDDVTYGWSIEKMVLKGEIEMPENLVFDGSEKSVEFNLTVGELFGKDAIAIQYDGDRVNAGKVTVTADLPSANYEFDPSSVTTAEMVIAPYALEISFSNLTVVYNTPTEEFDINSIVATVRGTSGAQIEIGGTMYDYTVVVEYADEMQTYQQGDPKDTTYPLTVTVTIEGLDASNYTYNKSASLKVIATPLVGVLVADGTNVPYDGLAHGATLTETTASEEDYEIQYALKGTDSWSTSAPVHAGTYTVRVVSTNDSYSGERITSIEIVILKKSVSIVANVSEVNEAYKGEISAETLASYFTAPQGVLEEGALQMAITVTGAGEKVNGVGVYTVTAKLASSASDYSASAVSIKYTVTPAKVEAPAPAQQQLTYNKTEQTFVVGDNALYTVSGNKGTDAGSYNAVVKLVDKKNYVWADTLTTADKTFAWSIAKAIPTVNPQVDGEVFYDGYDMPEVSLAAGDTEGEISWDDAKLQLGKSEYGWKFFPTDTKNYENASGTMTLTVTEVSLISISATVGEGKFIYTSSSLEDVRDSLVISGVNNDGTPVEKISNDLVRVEGSFEAGVQTFKVFYLDDESVTCEVSVTVTAVQLAYIEAEFVQDDLTVYANSSLEILKANLTVNGFNNDGSACGVITDYTLSGSFDSATSVITVHYTGSATQLEIEDVTFIVIVSAAQLDRIEITAQPAKTAYTAYDQFDRSGLEVTAYYTDGTDKLVEDYYIPNESKILVSDATDGLEVQYTDGEIMKTARVMGLTVAKLQVELRPAGSQTFIYNGNPQNLVYSPSPYYTMTGNVETNAGSYTAYMVLNDKENTVWADSGDVTMDYPVPWEIKKRSVSIVRSNEYVGEKTYDGEAVTADYLKQFFSVSVNITDDDNFTLEDIGISVSFANGESQVVNAGQHNLVVKLSNEAFRNFNANTLNVNYQINKASKIMLVDMTVGYKKLTVDLDNGLEDAYYSFDNKTWKPLESLNIAVGMSDKYDVYFKYNEGKNYLASKAVLIEKKITKAALYEYIKDTFDDTFTKEDIAAFEEFNTYAKDPDGTSAEYDKAYADLLAKYNKVAGELNDAISSALSAGSKMAGYHSTAIAVSWTLSSVGTGVALVALSVSARKKGEKKSRLRRAAVAGLLLAAVIAGAVFAFGGCEKVEVDNMAKVLEIVKNSNNLKVQVLEDESSIYTYDNGAITVNKYNLLLNVNALIGEKTDANISLTKDNFVSGYTIILDESTGNATVKGKLKSTGNATLDGANVEIVCNIKTETTSKYQVTYTDAWGYNVVIDIA